MQWQTKRSAAQYGGRRSNLLPLPPTPPPPPFDITTSPNPPVALAEGEGEGEGPASDFCVLLKTDLNRLGGRKEGRDR